MNHNILVNKSILLTGGTGSFGRYFVKYIIDNKIKVKKLIIFSRDELKQFEMNNLYSTKKYKFMRYFLGDVRDSERLSFACRDVDIVLHAAALKQVPAAEYNPFEYVSTNIIGAQNLISACLKNSSIKNVIALSTDKAVSAINLYGATKLCSDKIFIAANNIIGNRDIKFSIVRYGNVFGSRGSMVDYLEKNRNNKKVTVTDVNMTRFNITLKEAVQFVISTYNNNLGGEIFVPKIPSYRIMDLIKAINPKAKIQTVGIRPGEKLHEEMISVNDSSYTVDAGKYYIILPSIIFNNRNEIFKKINFRKVKKDFIYNSETNPHFLTINEIKKIFNLSF
jgi:UDP-N-acetylglucosamine 4,6-dehydratase